jgi:hypothetical protein
MKFHDKLQLSNSASFKIFHGAMKHNPRNWMQHFNKVINKKFTHDKKPVILELYHVIRDYDLDKLNLIFEHGFPLQEDYQNRVFLTNNPRWAVNWGNKNTIPQHVVICDVWYDEKHIDRHKSAYYHPSLSCSDYFVKDSELIYPKYFVQFETNAHKLEPENYRFTKFEELDCKNLRCAIKRKCFGCLRGYDEADVYTTRE